MYDVSDKRKNKQCLISFSSLFLINTIDASARQLTDQNGLASGHNDLGRKHASNRYALRHTTNKFA